jgi:hypothetical protein
VSELSETESQGIYKTIVLRNIRSSDLAIQCDRVKPCRACCTRGAPSECEYGTTKKDRHFIEQSDLIERLRSRCKQLEDQLTDAAKDGIKTPDATDGKQVSGALANRPARAGALIRPLAMKGSKNAGSKDDSKVSVPSWCSKYLAHKEQTERDTDDAGSRKGGSGGLSQRVS